MKSESLQPHDYRIPEPDFVLTIDPKAEDYLKSINAEVKGFRLILRDKDDKLKFSTDLAFQSRGVEMARLELADDHETLLLIGYDEEGKEIQQTYKLK